MEVQWEAGGQNRPPHHATGPRTPPRSFHVTRLRLSALGAKETASLPEPSPLPFTPHEMNADRIPATGLIQGREQWAK